MGIYIYIRWRDFQRAVLELKRAHVSQKALCFKITQRLQWVPREIYRPDFVGVSYIHFPINLTLSSSKVDIKTLLDAVKAASLVRFQRLPFTPDRSEATDALSSSLNAARGPRRRPSSTGGLEASLEKRACA